MKNGEKKNHVFLRRINILFFSIIAVLMLALLYYPKYKKLHQLNITEEKLAIIKLLSKYGSLSIGNIASIMQKDRSTVYRHISSLIEMGLVSQKGKLYELTSLGYMLA